MKTTKLAPLNLHVMVKSVECTGCYECHREASYRNSSNETPTKKGKNRFQF